MSVLWNQLLAEVLGLGRLTQMIGDECAGLVGALMEPED